MFENVRLAFQGIWSHKMRSFLTMLGIIIGIGAIIAIVSTIKGTSEQIKQDLIGSGNNTVKINLKDGDYDYNTSYGASGAITPLLSDTLKEKVRKQENVLDATFYYSRSTDNVYYKEKTFSGGTIYGIDERFLSTMGYKIQTGRNFIPRDYSQFSKVALLDSNAVQNLFPDEEPLGKTLEIGSEPFIIVGVVTSSSDSLPKINDISDFYTYFTSIMGSVMIPDRTWPVAFKFDEPQNAIVRADSTDTMSSVGKAVEDVMNTAVTNVEGKTNLKYKADDVMEKVKNMQKLSESTQQQLVWIAGISLLVGGIGVMNIMLVSVTERTKEIGLKKAIGARKNTILHQFLTEAAVLTSIGGLLGVALGIILSKIVSRVSGAPTAISVPAIVGSVVFSMVIGIVFGLLPSVKAANLNPIAALRSE